MILYIESRPATADDYDFVARVYFESERWVIDQALGWDAARENEKFRRQFAPEEIQIVILVGQTIGWYQLHEEGGSIAVQGVYILNAWHAHGIELHVLNAVINRARAEKKDVLFNAARIDRSKKLFEQLGFPLIREENHMFRLRYVEPAEADRQKTA